MLRTPDGYMMWFTGADTDRLQATRMIGQAEAYGFAHSQDGISWTKYEGNPIIEEKTYGIEWLRKGYADLLFHDSVLYLYLEVLEREGGAWAHGNSDYYSNVFLLRHEGLP